MIDFLTGNLTDNTTGVSWKGKYGNQTYNELESTLFNKDYSNIDTPDKLSEDEFIVTHGFCKKIESNYTVEQKFMTTEKTELLIVDPNKFCKQKIQKTDDSSIAFGPTDEINGYFRI